MDKRLQGKNQAARLVAIFDMLGRGDSLLSDLLGYKNPSVIHKIRRGESFMGPVRLSVLANFEVAPGYFPNLHWILVGAGSAVIGPDAVKVSALTNHAASLTSDALERFDDVRSGEAQKLNRHAREVTRRIDRTLQRQY